MLPGRAGVRQRFAPSTTANDRPGARRLAATLVKRPVHRQTFDAIRPMWPPAVGEPKPTTEPDAGLAQAGASERSRSAGPAPASARPRRTTGGSADEKPPLDETRKEKAEDSGTSPLLIGAAASRSSWADLEAQGRSSTSVSAERKPDARCSVVMTGHDRRRATRAAWAGAVSPPKWSLASCSTSVASATASGISRTEPTAQNQSSSASSAAVPRCPAARARTVDGTATV